MRDAIGADIDRPRTLEWWRVEAEHQRSKMEDAREAIEELQGERDYYLMQVGKLLDALREIGRQTNAKKCRRIADRTHAAYWTEDDRQFSR